MFYFFIVPLLSSPSFPISLSMRKLKENVSKRRACLDSHRIREFVYDNHTFRNVCHFSLAHFPLPLTSFSFLSLFLLSPSPPLPPFSLFSFSDIRDGFQAKITLLYFFPLFASCLPMPFSRKVPLTIFSLQKLTIDQHGKWPSTVEFQIESSQFKSDDYKSNNSPPLPPLFFCNFLFLILSCYFVFRIHFSNFRDPTSFSYFLSRFK